MVNSIFLTISMRKKKEINYRYINIIISKNLNYKINYISKNIFAKILKQIVHNMSLKATSYSI